MERKNLIYFSEQIDMFTNGINYDKTREFQIFRLEMQKNLITFFTPEYYKKNIDIVKCNIEQMQMQELSKYHLRFLKDLTQYIRTLKECEQTTINFEKDKDEIIQSIHEFLDPKYYMTNIQILTKRVENQKRLTPPYKWC